MALLPGWLWPRNRRSVRQGSSSEADSQARFEALFELAPDAYYLNDLKGTFIAGNRASEELIGYRREELVGRSFLSHPLLPKSQLARAAKHLALNVVGASAGPEEFTLNRKDGSQVQAEIRTAPVKIEGRTLVLGIARDITLRRALEQKLRETTESFAAIVEQNAAGILVADAAGTVRFANAAACRFLGCPRNELEGARLADYGSFVNGTCFPIPAEDGGLGTGQVRTMESTWQREEATIYMVEDVTHRTRQERLLAASQEQYAALLEHHVDAVVVTVRGQVVHVNERMCQISGRTAKELLGRSAIDFIAPEDRQRASDRLTALYRGGPGRSGEYGIAKGDGTTLPAEVSSRAITFYDEPAALSVVRDLSEKKAAEEALRKSEEQLRQSQKMEALGTLAGGVAHDFNNLLTVVTGCAELVLENLSADDPLCADLQRICQAGEQAASLTYKLLSLSRQEVSDPRVLDLNAVVEESEGLFQRTIEEHVELRTELAPGLASIHADPAQIGQVLLNLIVNARDAMPDGGVLTIRTADLDLNGADPLPHADLERGPYVLLVVTDTGIGMDGETLGRIYEPFFTTKQRATSSGLGLSTVYGIVRQSGGQIRATSTVGRGTRFEVYFPSVAGPASPEETKSLPKGELSGSETVLVVEDQAEVRHLVGQVLESRGYRVLSAPDPKEALQLSARYPGPIDLLVTDLVMPGGSGIELAKSLEEERPEARSLFISGYAAGATLEDAGIDRQRFLGKPFTPSELASRVRWALDRDVSSATPAR